MEIRSRWFILSAILVSLAMIILYYASYSYFQTNELQRAQSRVSLYRSTLLNALDKFDHLPYILAHDPFVIAAAAGKDRNILNKRLQIFSKQAGLDAIYLLDTTGLTVAASNYKSPFTFLNQNYSFRPYFRAAMQGHKGTFFGIGATTSLPGYFIAEPVYDHSNKLLGAIAIKLALTELQEAWRSGGENIFVSNKDGVIVLASNSSWLYKTLTPLSAKRRKKILAEKQFINQPLPPMNFETIENSRVRLNGTPYLHVSSDISNTGSKVGWKLHFLAEETRVEERALFTIIITGIALSFLITTFALMRSKRIRIALEASQQDRRLLKATNANLEQEIEERRMAEQRLDKAQSALARASKLAALGQLSASVTHELGQPLAAMRNYLTAAEFDGKDFDHTPTLERINSLVIRMEHITKQLRFFAKPGEDQIELVNLKDVVQNAIELTTHDLSANQVKLTINTTEKPTTVRGNKLRLEQVVINLISNSIAAMEEAHDEKHNDRKLDITITATEDEIILTLSDTGTGLGNRTIEQLQEPFHTTRASGRGMGLGLAISAAIVKEHEGQLSAENRPDNGACFTLKLPIATEEI